MNMASEGLPNDQIGELPEAAQRALVTGTNVEGPSKPVTMATIARAANVSQGAISSLLNDRDYGIRVSLKTRDRVFKVCRELGYIPNDLRAVVRMYPDLGETCLLVSSKVPGGLLNPFVARASGALMANSPRQPASLALAFYEEARDYGPDDPLPFPLKNAIASRIIFIGAANASVCWVAHHRGHPVIALGHTAHIPGSTSVVPDYLGAARLALGLFVKHGHKHVGVVGGPFGGPDPRFAELDRAIGMAAQELGLQMEAQDIFHGNLTFESGVEALYSLLGRTTPPTAVLCLSETAATGVLAGAHARGISVPGKLSVIAVADHEGTLPSCLPLTAVALPVEEMAATALREADRQLRAGLPVDAQKLVVGVKLLERMTCGPAAA